jgi:hypothetical protein
MRFIELDTFLRERGFKYLRASNRRDMGYPDDRYVWVKDTYKVEYYWRLNCATVSYKFVGASDHELVAAGVMSLHFMELGQREDKQWLGNAEYDLERIDSNLRDCRFYKKQDAKDYLGVFL